QFRHGPDRAGRRPVSRGDCAARRRDRDRPVGTVCGGPMITGVLSAGLERHLPRLLPAFQSFASRSHSRWTVEQIIEEIRGQTVQVWICNDYQAVALTRVWPDAVSIVACAGSDRGNWCAELEAEIRAWAKHLGKKHLLIDGRPGWSRWLKTIGYQEAHREMVI